MRILVPTDFSESARNAFDYAVHMAKDMEDVEFFLLNSYEMPSGGSAGGVMMNLEDAMSKESKRDLSIEMKYINETYPGLKVTTVSRYGSLENAVARTNREEDISFVVMGTHGVSGIEKALIGNNARNVMENVERPVISVPGNWKYNGIKTVVYATDLKKLDNPEILMPVCRLAELNDASIHVVYVAEHADKIDIEEEVKKLALNEQFPKRKRILQVVESADVSEAIDGYVQEVKADMVVMIPKTTSFWKRLFKGSVTESMAFKGNVPMLSLRDV